MAATMHWLAWQGPAEGAPAELRQACVWWALRFTPRVALAGPVLLLEVSDCLRLWGGRRGLLASLRRGRPEGAPWLHAEGATSLVALARLRLRQQGRSAAEVAALAAADLPWSALDAAGPAAAAPSCAPLRLALRWAGPAQDSGVSGPRLRVDLLRRRGPPLERPLWLPAQGAALQALLASTAAPARPSADVLIFPHERGAHHGSDHALAGLARAS